MIERPKTPAMNKGQMIKIASKNLLYALILLSIGATASPAQEVSQSVEQSINGIDRGVHAEVTGRPPDQTGSRSRSQSAASTWGATQSATPSAQPASAASSRTHQPEASPVWSSSVNKTAATSAKREHRTAVSGTNGASAPSSRFTPTFGHVGGTPSAIRVGLRSSGRSTHAASGTRKHLSPASAANRHARNKLQPARSTRRARS
jgi:hypothetical protein